MLLSTSSQLKYSLSFPFSLSFFLVSLLLLLLLLSCSTWVLSFFLLFQPPLQLKYSFPFTFFSSNRSLSYFYTFVISSVVLWSCTTWVLFTSPVCFLSTKQSPSFHFLFYFHSITGIKLVLSQDTLIFLGEFNTTSGIDKISYELCVGPQGPCTRDFNSSLLLNFAGSKR